jgi:anti-sigma regulatory factor (Ser/Thr protein kinase)
MALLEGWGNEGTQQDARLLLSEVVTNAVRHARGGAILVAVTLSPTHLRAQVHDDSPNPPFRRAGSETGGWGLALLEELSTQWGVAHHTHDGKIVWFEIDAARPV